MRHTEIEVTFKSGAAAPESFMVPCDIAKQLKTQLEHELEWLHRDTAGFIPAREVMPEAYDPVMGPAIRIRGLRYREQMTQKDLAAQLGIRQHHLSEMEHGKRPIGKAMAKKLAEILNADWRSFL